MTTETTRITLTRRQTGMLNQQVRDHMCALKNWIASRVEAGKYDEAQALVAELREYEELQRMTSDHRFDRHQSA